MRRSFLTSCLDNATNTAKRAATEERLLGGKAGDEESGRLVSWSTDCAREATG